MPGYQRFDSMAVDSEGNIWVGTLVTGVVTVISPNGVVIDEIKFPDTHVTNLCFGGSDLRTVYVTLAQTGRLAMLRWPVPGLALNFTA
jgi:gluconolactonase